MTRKQIQNYYSNQVELLLDVLPIIQEDPRFALKGGTAINLFYRDMPRLSVDIDITYLNIEPRKIFLANLTSAMINFSDKLRKIGFSVDYKYSGATITKLLVSNKYTTIKVEPNSILRGTVFSPQIKELTQNAQALFLQSQMAKVVSFADLYAGKICAVLDRQHPRDLFDIKLLLENEGLTDETRQVFVIYLASSQRPINELLAPNKLDLRTTYENEFIGMTNIEVSYNELLSTRDSLIAIIHEALKPNEKKFLLSLKSGEPQWSLMPLPGIEQLPGI